MDGVVDRLDIGLLPSTPSTSKPSLSSSLSTKEYEIGGGGFFVGRVTIAGNLIDADLSVVDEVSS